MNQRMLGRTGLAVSEVSMGGAFITAERAQGIAAVRYAFQEAGLNYVDTAAGYGNSEEVLGEALEGVTADYFLSTKLGARPQPFDPRDKAALRASVEESLRLLKRDHIEILMIHEPDRPEQYDWWTDWDHFYGPVTELLAELKQEGVIRFTGLGGTTPYIMPNIMDTGEYDVVLTAFNYSMLWQEARWEVFPAAKRNNMGLIVGSPLQQGWLSRRFDEEINHGAPWLSLPRRRQFQALYALVEEIGMPLPELAQRFVLSNPEISTMLIGARSVEEVKLGVAAAEKGPLPTELLDRVQEIADMVPFRPFEEPFGCQLGRPEYRGPGMAC